MRSDDRNSIECTSTHQLTKSDLIDLIESNFPDTQVGFHSAIAVMTTTTLTDRTQMQSITFGKILR